MSEKRLNPILRIILIGVYDQNSDFNKLLGIPHLTSRIWRIVVNYWKAHITKENYICYKGVKKPPDIVEDHLGYCIPNLDDGLDLDFGFDKYYVDGNNISFPKRTNLNINMMPYVMEGSFEKCLLPETVRGYWDIIARCHRNLIPQGYGKIGYLTIQESYVEENTSQRRPGIHTETPGMVTLYEDNEFDPQNISYHEGKGLLTCRPEFVCWGGGYFSCNTPIGGIYMASSVADSCRIWNCRVLRDKSGKEIIGELGSVDHLREFLPDGEILKKNTIYWFTDRTPHESLPIKNGTYRQFFRLVTHEVSVWYADHSTKNVSVTPDPKFTKIVKGSKFNEDEKLIVVNNYYKL